MTGRNPSRAPRWQLAEPPAATIVPFPIAARRDLVGRIVQQMLERSPGDAEECLRQHVMCQERTLFRKQVPPEAIARELEGLQGAVRAGLWRAVLGGGYG